MDELPDVPAGKLGLLIGRQAERETMMQLTAVLASQGPVFILDGGNQFDAYQVARYLRRQTPQLEDALNRITIARAFTCYQVVSLMAQTPTMAVPVLVLDLLSTFTDESVTEAESFRLLRLVLPHLQRFRVHAPVAVSVRLPPQPGREGLVTLLRAVADVVSEREIQPVITNTSWF